MTQPTVTPRSISWATDQGFMYSANPVNGRHRFRHRVGTTILGRIVALPPDRLVAASVDGFVHCVHETTGDLLWRFSSGDRIVESPLAIDPAVYVATEYGNLYCLSAETGQPKWNVSGIRRVIAASEKRLYARDVDHHLVAIDLDSGSRLASVPLYNFDISVSNFLTDRIYFASSSGRLVCLRERRQGWPRLHPLAQHELDVAQERLEQERKLAAGITDEVPSKPAAGAEPAEDPTTDEGLFEDANLFEDQEATDDLFGDE